MTARVKKLGFDPGALRAKYREERDKRLRPRARLRQLGVRDVRIIEKGGDYTILGYDLENQYATDRRRDP